MTQYLTNDNKLPLVSIYDNDEDGWSALKTYRGIPPAIGDKLTIERRWPNKREIGHYTVTNRHLSIETTHGSTTIVIQKFEIGVTRAESDPG